MAKERGFSLREAQQIAGFEKPHMLDYLHRQGIVVPSIRATPGRGSRRRYSFRDLVYLKAVNHLLSRGLSVRRLKKALDILRSDFPDLERYAVITSKKLLVTDGQHIFLRIDEKAFMELVEGGQLAFAFLVDVESVRRDIAIEANKLSA